MSDRGGVAGIERHGQPAPVTRIVGWSMLGVLAAFLINNVLIVGFGFTGPESILASKSTSIVPTLLYVIAIGISVYYVLRSPDTSLRWDARCIHMANIYIIRSFFFAALIVGVADIVVSFMRVEGFFALFLEIDNVRNFQRPSFVGMYIHFPLVILGFIVGAFTRTLGFSWLALLIIIAELSIVITRFVFSYEQAFMGDLVRYWYSALFLFASAYTLYDEGHVRVDVLYAGFRAKKKGLLNVFGALFLGIPTCWVILIVGFAGKQSIINSPVMNFEVTQTGSIGLYIKYQMAAFLGIFAATMLIQFISFLFEAVADYRAEPGHRNTDIVAQ
ncbi:MAG: TRAP transporter small permease subunit [Rhizobiales bacterium]|nr:TRAP transporter small permease subunit [Hyphomicrobiales bacterium]